MMFNKDIIKDLIEDRFEMDFQKVFIKDKIDKRINVLTGYGHIRKIQNSFRLKMFVKDKITPNYYKKLEKHEDNGQNYFTALDKYGDRWYFQGFINSIEHASSTRAVNIILVNCKYLESNAMFNRTDDEEIIELLVPIEYGIPFNKYRKEKVQDENGIISSRFKDIISYNCDEMSIEGFDLDYYVWLIIKKKTIEPHFETRVIESLKFITGRPVNQIATIIRRRKTEKLIYYSEFQYDTYYKFPPPLHIYDFSHERHTDIWILFTKFLKTVLKSRGAYYSPLGAEINGLIGAGPSYFNTKILVLCVRIEGILNLLYKNKGIPSSKYINEIKSINDLIADIEISQSIKNRLMSLVSSMLHPRAKDRLFFLLRKGVINRIQFKAWSQLRNKSAHAVRSRGHELIENSLRKYYHVIEMMYRIVFSYIGYTETYTCYGKAHNRDEKFRVYTTSENKLT